MYKKVALVTGAGKGIGRATALLLAQRDISVVVADVDAAKAEEVVTIIHSQGGSAHAVIGNVTKEADVEAMVACAEAVYGGLDYGINNAGILGASGVPLDMLSADQWLATISVNLTGLMFSMKHELKAMLRRGGGAIVNVSSAAGLVATPHNPAYCASKHGVLGLSKAAACAYAQRGIRINAVCPGPVRTDLMQDTQDRRSLSDEQVVAPIPLARMASPQEIAESIVWLCSDSSSYVVGHALSIDGGWVAL